MPKPSVRRIARVRHDGRTRHGLVRGRRVHFIRGGPFGRLEPTGESAALSGVRLLAPVRPTKVLGIGLNYRSHLGTLPGREAPTSPEAFLKAPSAVIGTEEPIVLPPDARQVEEEGEIVVVIGRRARNVARADIADYILGYSCGNDVSAREWQHKDLQWWRAKATDTFAAVGPWITTGLDPDTLHLRVRVNGTEVQAAPASEMIHPILDCIAYLTRWITLERGDLVYTGTPGETALIEDGDVVEVEIDGIGVLRNPVRRAPPFGTPPCDPHGGADGGGAA